MQQFFSLTTDWCRPYLTEISFSFVATILVLFGDRISGELKKITSGYHYTIRVLAFILLNGFGYGLATLFLTDVFVKILRYKTGDFLGLIVIGIFLVLGIMADRKKYI